jgi:hypothetical protein
MTKLINQWFATQTSKHYYIHQFFQTEPQVATGRKEK